MQQAKSAGWDDSGEGYANRSASVSRHSACWRTQPNPSTAASKASKKSSAVVTSPRVDSERTRWVREIRWSTRDVIGLPNYVATFEQLSAKYKFGRLAA